MTCQDTTGQDTSIPYDGMGPPQDTLDDFPVYGCATPCHGIWLAAFRYDNAFCIYRSTISRSRRVSRKIAVHIPEGQTHQNVNRTRCSAAPVITVAVLHASCGHIGNAASSGGRGPGHTIAPFQTIRVRHQSEQSRTVWCRTARFPHSRYGHGVMACV